MSNLASVDTQPAEPVATNRDLRALRRDFDRDGFVLVRSVLGPEEIREIRERFAEINAAEQERGTLGTPEPVPAAAVLTDPLTRYPRVLHPHRFDSLARHYMLHPQVWIVLEALFGEEPVAVQSMFYFKPPGARGQAMHQDQLYLMVQPGTCIAAWTAIDDCDIENGAMYLVPETGDAEVVCPGKANPKVSFTDHLVPVPRGKKARILPMKAGDTLFFNGSTLHGSGPNRSRNRFRRSFIGHYAASSADKISRFYLPMVRKDGSDVEIEINTAGGPCGTEWQGAAH